MIRAGGSTVPATSTITTSDGSAVAGTDYTPVHSSVFFADGDDTPRAVEVPLLRGGEGDRTLTITLTEPGGCATLGSLASAELTIRDENPAPPVQPVGLDPTFGTGGKATTTAFGGDRSSMALQTDGKIVMAGGTFTAFVLARFDADGTLDDSFGSLQRRHRHDQHRRPAGGPRRRHPARPRRQDRRGRLRRPGRHHRRPLLARRSGRPGVRDRRHADARRLRRCRPRGPTRWPARAGRHGRHHTADLAAGQRHRAVRHAPRTRRHPRQDVRRQRHGQRVRDRTQLAGRRRLPRQRLSPRPAAPTDESS